MYVAGALAVQDEASPAFYPEPTPRPTEQPSNYLSQYRLATLLCRSRMVHLDRENGAILLPDGSVVPYDVLVLCTGLQVREGLAKGAARIGPDQTGPAGKNPRWGGRLLSARKSSRNTTFVRFLIF